MFILQNITEKQWSLIQRMCEMLEIEFKGKTRKEASNFISEHLQEFQHEEERDEILSHIQYEEHGFLY